MAPVTERYENLPRFPDGRINYTHSNSAPIVACVIEYNGKSLIAKRSESVSHHKNTWDIITGYIDDPKKSEIDHTILELEEELGIKEDHIKSIQHIKSFDYIDEISGRHLLVFAVLIDMDLRPEIKLNHENIDFKWIDPNNAPKYNMPDLAIKVLKLIERK